MRSAGTILVITLLTLALFQPCGAFSASSQSSTSKKPPSKSTSKSSGAKPAQKPASTARRDADNSAANRTKLESVPSRREELRGIWITTDGPRSNDEWDAIMRKLKTNGLNAAFVRVAQGGKAIYPSKVVAQDVWASEAEGDELAKAVTAAHNHGIQLHAWKVCFNMGSEKARPEGSAPFRFYQRMVKEDRLVRDPNGKQGNWLNPSDPRNHDLEVRVASEIVQKYDVDGYHLDYIRYPDESSRDFPGEFPLHFGDVSRREFEKVVLGSSVKNWPEDVISGPHKMRYETWERDNITRLVARLRTELKAKRPTALFSAAVWRKAHLYRSRLKQDWPRWGRDGLVDFLVLMAYEKELADFRTVVARDFSHICGRVPFVVGIGGFLPLQPEAVVEQVKASRELGADGFALFSLNDPTDKKADNKNVTAKGLVDRQLAALAAGATRSAAVPSVGGPHLEFALSQDVVARRYQTHAAESGHVSQVSIRLPRVSGASGELRVAVSVEDLKGKKIGDTQELSLKSGGERTIPLVAAVTSVRPVVRGSIGQGTAARPFVIRGPIVEPVSRSDIAELRARELPPEISGSGTKVGVYFNGLGSDAILDALDSAKGVSAVMIYRLEATHLAKLEVLVLPHIFDLADMTPEAAATLRKWVESGGRLILTRDACGLRWHPRLFPEVGKGTKLSSATNVQVATALRGYTRGAKFDHEGKDHAQLEAGPAGKVLATESKTGKPIVVAGSVGKGHVILDGMMPGNDEESGAGTNSMRLLISLLNHR